MINNKYMEVFPLTEETSVGVRKNCPECKKFMKKGNTPPEMYLRGGMPSKFDGFTCGNCGNSQPAYDLIENTPATAKKNTAPKKPAKPKNSKKFKKEAPERDRLEDVPPLEGVVVKTKIDMGKPTPPEEGGLSMIKL